VEKVNDEENLEADIVRFEKNLKAWPRRPWVVIPGRSSHEVSGSTNQELQAA